ncbi:MAG TPA: DUF87 domain-containing protein [Anaerolineaceae bacterium]
MPFYLGKSLSSAPIAYDPADLTTHAVVVGMTGSGKTGLCIGLLEEAALAGVPALIIDPKGDLTNLLLHFPQLAPADFQPWIDPEAARRTGKPLEALAVETASAWQAGLAEWNILPERVAALAAAARFGVFTPGSDAGYPVSILASLKAPALGWEGNKEVLREKIASTVTALLGLVGYKDVDPMRSREHILLSNIFEAAWSQAKDLDLTELILQTQTPPFDKLGVFPVDKFFPQTDRFQLAMLLNNFLAAPSFQTWIEGQPLDAASLLFTPEGLPRHSIFYLAHLEDAERMFFVTLLFSAVETWMRTQSGTSGLRALVYFDEIAGYLPPVANPPSKPVMLRMLKQARAFGVGLLLASQNPVDIDYKALSNAGTWFVGKLQTEQDKERLLDGLLSAAGGLDRAELDRQISALGKRVFLLNNVHAGPPALFQTRWTMNYLAGPLTRTQIPALNRLAESSSSAAKPEGQPAQPGFAAAPSSSAGAVVSQPSANPAEPVTAAPVSAPNGTQTRPAVPGGVDEYFFPNNLTFTEAAKSAGKTLSPQPLPGGLLYYPALLAQVEIRFLDRRYGVEATRRTSALVQDPDRRGLVRWDEHPFHALDPQKLERNPAPQARFASLDAPFTDARSMAALQKDFLDWAYRGGSLCLASNPALKLYGDPDETAAAFAARCAQAAQQEAAAENAKLDAGYQKKLAVLQEKLAKEQRQLSSNQGELSQRKMDELGTGLENVLSLFGGRKKRLSSSLTKHRLTQQVKSDIDESQVTIADLQKQIAALQQERAATLQAITDRWTQQASAIEDLTLIPKKTDIFLDVFGLTWLPYYLVQDGDTHLEFPAFA